MNPRTGERLNAALWAVIGAVILVASWRMDRLEDRGISPWSAPGITPGVVGVLITVLALVLAWPSPPAADGGTDAGAGTAAGTGGAEQPAGEAAAAGAPDGEQHPWRRTLLALALCVGFAALALGRGLPFVVESAVFIFSFTTVFSLPLWRAQGRVVRGLAQTAAVAVVTSLLVSWLFESVFLVRLP